MMEYDEGRILDEHYAHQDVWWDRYFSFGAVHASTIYNLKMLGNIHKHQQKIVFSRITTPFELH